MEHRHLSNGQRVTLCKLIVKSNQRHPDGFRGWWGVAWCLRNACWVITAGVIGGLRMCANKLALWVPGIE